MTDRFRIKLLVIDIIERMILANEIRVIGNGTILYTGSVAKIPQELLNKEVVNIYAYEYSNYFYIIIE